MSWIGHDCSGVGCDHPVAADDFLHSDDWWNWMSDFDNDDWMRPDSVNVHIPYEDWVRDPVPTTETSYGSIGARVLLAIMSLVTLVVVFYIGFRVWQKRDDESNDGNNNTNEDRSNADREVPSGGGDATGRAVSTNGTSNTTAASPRVSEKLAELPLEERMVLYSEAFNHNQNQTILDESAIVMADIEQDGNRQQQGSEKPNHSYDDEDSYCSILRELANMQTVRRSITRGAAPTIERKSYSSNSLMMTMTANSSRIDMAGDRKQHSDDDLDETVIIFQDSASVTDSYSDSDSAVSRNEPPREASNIVHPRCRTVPGGDVENGTMLVPRTCIICFEEMKPGEMIVWSETESCPHVYHKDCIVSFFAHKKQTAQQLGIDHNPCPTCRQSFVTVCGKAGF